MNEAPTGEAARRARVCHGWAFRAHTYAEMEAIRKYLETGVMWDDLPDQYRKLDAIVK
jgi:hypothetical protein